MDKIKVIIVDDSAFVRELFTGFLNCDDTIEVVATASDPIEAREKIKQCSPDVISLDIEMPNMDGISFLEKIMTLRPLPVLMVSSLTQKGADATIRALELGAVDYIGKPVSQEDYISMKDELITKIKLAATAKVRPYVKKDEATRKSEVIINTKGASDKLIVLGSSAGGVEAIKEVLCRLPKNCPPILITQHMPKQFTKAFAERLNDYCELHVQEAEDGQKIEHGNVYVAPGTHYHLEIGDPMGVAVCKLTPGDLVSGHKPSVDVMFKSAIPLGNRIIGVILTGMGADGAEGMKMLKDVGSYNIGQSAESCMVYGMPKAAKNKGGVDIELPVEQIPKEIMKHI